MRAAQTGLCSLLMRRMRLLWRALPQLLEDVIRLANAARQRNVYATATPEIELLFSRSSLRDRPDLCVPDDRHYLSRSARQPW